MLVVVSHLRTSQLLSGIRWLFFKWEAPPVGPGAIIEANEIASKWRDKGVKYAKDNNLSITWDNEADAYRHFGWNAEMTRELGKNKASFIATNHEAAYMTIKGQYDNVFGDHPVLEFSLATLMDLHNNKVGRNLADSEYFSDYSIDELFQLALDSDVVITSLDQVSSKYGFSKDIITDKQTVYVVLDKKTEEYHFIDAKELKDE